MELSEGGSFTPEMHPIEMELKRALTSLGGTTGTLVYQAANLTNGQPIDAKAKEQEHTIEYLNPNSLILGRATPGGGTCGLNLETMAWHKLPKLGWIAFGQNGGNLPARIYSFGRSGIGQRGMFKSAILSVYLTQMP